LSYTISKTVRDIKAVSEQFCVPQLCSIITHTRVRSSSYERRVFLRVSLDHVHFVTRLSFVYSLWLLCLAVPVPTGRTHQPDRMEPTVSKDFSLGNHVNRHLSGKLHPVCQAVTLSLGYVYAI